VDINRYDVDGRLDPDGSELDYGELRNYLEEKLFYYEAKALIYRADTIRKILKDLK
jgi:hypothetical protein